MVGSPLVSHRPNLVVLVVDREFTLHLAPSHARRLGADLRREADLAEGVRPRAAAKGVPDAGR